MTMPPSQESSSPTEPAATNTAANPLSRSRINSIFAQLHQEGRKAIIPFICGGSPTAESTSHLLRALDAAGANIIEVGFPYSDPLADGPVIAEAMHAAIAMGVSPKLIFGQVASVRNEIRAGIVAMISISIVHKMSGGKPAQFVAMAQDAGFDGIIVPDAPLEESTQLSVACSERGLSYIQLIAPTTPPQRIERIVNACSGFVYVLARVGITGAQNQLPNIAPLVQRVRTHTSLPVAVGFGVSNASHVEAVHRFADGAIIGSALVKEISLAAREGRDTGVAAGEFVKKLSAASS